MQRRFRLTRSDDFKRVRSNGKSYAHPLIVLVTTPTSRPGPRIGIVAGGSIGGAIERNRAKRVLREAARPLIPFMDPGIDALLIARPAMLSRSLLEVQQALRSLLTRAKALRISHESPPSAAE